VDVVWGPSFVVMGATAALAAGSVSARGLLISALVLAWALRLALHIALRKRGRGEDFRYAQWRRQWGRHVLPRSFLQVFMLQGLIAWLVAMPLLWTLTRPAAPLGLWDLPALAVWLVGLLFQWLGDAQLAAFKRDPENSGKLMDRGLWSLSRHPNYFGEAAMGWGIGLLALPVEGAWWTLASPVLMTYLLLKVSGVPLLEEAMRRRPGYEEYARRTPVFFPRITSFGRKEKGS